MSPRPSWLFIKSISKSKPKSKNRLVQSSPNLSLASQQIRRETQNLYEDSRFSIIYVVCLISLLAASSSPSIPGCCPVPIKPHACSPLGHSICYFLVQDRIFAHIPWGFIPYWLKCLWRDASTDHLTRVVFSPSRN